MADRPRRWAPWSFCCRLFRAVCRETEGEMQHSNSASKQARKQADECWSHHSSHHVSISDPSYNDLLPLLNMAPTAGRSTVNRPHRALRMQRRGETLATFAFATSRSSSTSWSPAAGKSRAARKNSQNSLSCRVVLCSVRHAHNHHHEHTVTLYYTTLRLNDRLYDPYSSLCQLIIHARSVPGRPWICQ